MNGLLCASLSRGQVFGFAMFVVVSFASVDVLRGSAASPLNVTNQLATQGFLFVDGWYVLPPYQIRFHGDELTINDHMLHRDDVVLTEYVNELISQEEDPSNAPFASIDAFEYFAAHTSLTLNRNGVVVITTGEEPLLIEEYRDGCDFLKTLRESSQWTVSLTGQPIRGTDQVMPTWRKQVAGLNITPTLLQRANLMITKADEVEQDNENRSESNLWVDRISYPLTMFAMVVVVFAFGHLLNHKPNAELSSVEGTPRSIVAKSLAIVALLSLVDLLWTVAAFQSGTMREMNPLASGLISDPLKLAAFKAIAVGTAITLLYRFHDKPVAQVASWWSCLVLTLVTARWLTFNSLFLA